MKHTCPTCTRYIRWALLMCFDCNAKLRDADGTIVIGGEHQYPIAPVEA